MAQDQLGSATPARPQVSMYAYPWDLHDEGVAVAARRLKDAGFTTAHVAFTYHVGTYLLPRRSAGPVHPGNMGAAYFQPRRSRYGDGVQPHVAQPVHENPDYMPQLLAAFADEGLTVRAWTVYAYNHALAAAHPQLAKRDAFGSRHPAQLCVGQPGFRRFALALTDDILSHPQVEGLFIEALCYFRYDYGLLNTKRAVSPDPRTHLLLGLCFCSGCTAAAQDAGLEITPFRQQVAQTIRRRLNRQPRPADDQPAAGAAWQQQAFDGMLARFAAVRSQLAAGLLHQVIEKVRQQRDGGIVEVMGFGGLAGDDAGSVRSRLDEAVVRPDENPATMSRRVTQARQEHASQTRVIAAFYPRDLTAQARLAGLLAASRAAGVDGYRVYNDGILSERQQRWLAQADWHPQHAHA